ncbi:hypothetical protein CFOL_v3_03400 [Cephalotus follicularis]|uniref:Uncharacterized protein n=1 Tax=Cephalotus follicularis TaxID=3775 RepID=A0A1Q3AVW7_CEPFO|nr:hypothetical protein CFOL_v3_03400 [Cephalotus follicularis]
MATRYNTYDTRSSTTSDPSSSTELRPKPSSRAIVKSKPSDLSSSSRSRTTTTDHHANITTLVKKLMNKKSSSSSALRPKSQGVLVLPPDVIPEDLKKTERKGANFTALHRKLFGKTEKEVKALSEVKGNARTLGMVLRSERELLSANKEQELEIDKLQLLIQDKNREVERLKDLCLKQREDIKALKSAILFPDVMNSQLQELLEKQDSELKQAKQVIPTLQRQVTSLTGQLQCLAEDLAEVKAEKGSARAHLQRRGSSPRSPTSDNKERNDSLFTQQLYQEFSSGDFTTPGGTDDIFLRDFNPCLTPCTKTKSKDLGCVTSYDERLSEKKMQICNELGFNSRIRKLSKSSDCCQKGSTMARQARISDQKHHKIF